MKNTLLFSYSTNILVRLLMVNMKNCLTPKNPMVTIENATPLLASYKEVPPPGGGGGGAAPKN